MIKLKLTNKIIALVFATFTALPSAFAETTGEIDIPKVSDAQVFAEFTDKLPAVANYFTTESEDAVINFYQQLYGQAESSERKRGRLTLYFTDDNFITRVVISQQNKKRQVDVLIEKNISQ